MKRQRLTHTVAVSPPQVNSFHNDGRKRAELAALPRRRGRLRRRCDIPSNHCTVDNIWESRDGIQIVFGFSLDRNLNLLTQIQCLCDCFNRVLGAEFFRVTNNLRPINDGLSKRHPELIFSDAASMEYMSSTIYYVFRLCSCVAKVDS